MPFKVSNSWEVLLSKNTFMWIVSLEWLLSFKKLVFQGAKRESVINLKSTADSLREVKETVDTETQWCFPDLVGEQPAGRPGETPVDTDKPPWILGRSCSLFWVTQPPPLSVGEEQQGCNVCDVFGKVCVWGGGAVVKGSTVCVTE